MYPRHRIDISAIDLCSALLGCGLPADRTQLASDVLSLWSSQADALVALSVRSVLDLWLETLALPAGSEILMSAITLPDMVRVVEAHQLVAVPVDLDPATLAPRVELIEQAITPRTRAMIVAHLFGGRVNLDPLATVARQHKLQLVEDNAQSFLGPGDAGHPSADMTLWSFGTIKTATALGGAIATVRDAEVLAAMRTRQATWPVQLRRAYLARLLKALAMVVLRAPSRFEWVARYCAARGRSLDQLISSSVRGFPGPELLRQIRRQPCGPLLALLARRLRHFDFARLADRAAVGEAFARELPEPFLHPGNQLTRRTHWVVPVAAPDADRFIAELREQGFDVTRNASSIGPVSAPAGRPRPRQAEELMSRLVFLPVYPEVDAAQRQRLLDTLRGMAGRYRGAQLAPSRELSSTAH